MVAQDSISETITFLCMKPFALRKCALQSSLENELEVNGAAAGWAGLTAAASAVIKRGAGKKELGSKVRIYFLFMEIAQLLSLATCVHEAIWQHSDGKNFLSSL